MRSVRTISRKDLTQEQLGWYLAGFVEGEGSFNISLRKKTDYKVQWQVVMSFNVSQKDPTLLRALQDRLHCGIIKVRKIDNLHSFDVTNPHDIIQNVIPFFQKYPVLSDSKRTNFSIFCKIAKDQFFRHRQFHPATIHHDHSRFADSGGFVAFENPGQQSGHVRDAD